MKYQLIVRWAHKLWHVVLYQLFYYLSGAHNKPTSDSKFDSTIEHQTNKWHLKLRNLENYIWSKTYILRKEFNNIPIIQADQLTPELFNELSENRTRPIVIKGLLRNTKAVKQWNKDYFRQYGDTKVFTFIGDLNDPMIYKSFTQSVDCEKITLHQFLDNVENPQKKMYINNVTSIFMDNPTLVDDMSLDIIKRTGSQLNKNTWKMINFFMGEKGTGSSLHCAAGGNFFFNIHGKKKWILIDPKYYMFLKSTPAKDLSFVISGRDMEDPHDNVLTALPKHEIILEPGDVLYNAPWWWHYVKNESDFTIGCAVRDHFTYWQSFYNNWMFMCMSSLTYRMNPWILKMVEKYHGKDYIINNSMKADTNITKHLSNSVHN